MNERHGVERGRDRAGARRHGESALIVQLLTRDHGRHAGLVRGGQGPKQRTVYQIGNRLAVTWKARLAEHLGTVAGELLRGHAARFLDDPARLACLAAAAAMAELALPEREPHPRAYDGFSALLDALEIADRVGGRLCRMGNRAARRARIRPRPDALRRHRREPRTSFMSHQNPARPCHQGRRRPYRDRLLPLPRFLVPGSNAAPAPQDLLDGLSPPPSSSIAASLRRMAGNCRMRVPVSLTCCSGSRHYRAARPLRRHLARHANSIGFE